MYFHLNTRITKCCSLWCACLHYTFNKFLPVRAHPHLSPSHQRALWHLRPPFEPSFYIYCLVVEEVFVGHHGSPQRRFHFQYRSSLSYSVLSPSKLWFYSVVAVKKERTCSLSDKTRVYVAFGDYCRSYVASN